MTPELREELERFDAMTGLELLGLVDDDRYDDALLVIDDLSEGTAPESSRRTLRDGIKQTQKQAFEESARGLQNFLKAGKVDEARRLYARAQRISREHPRLDYLDLLMTSADRKGQQRKELEGTLARARALAGPGAFLPALRDARAYYDTLLAKADRLGDGVDAALLEEERQQVARRITAEEAHHSVIGTKSTLADIGPNLDALKSLIERREAGEQEVALKGAELTPIVVVIQDLEDKVRPKLGRLIGLHFDEAQRQFEETGDAALALGTLTRQREVWHYLEDELRGRLDTFEARLRRLTDQSERLAELIEEAKDLLRQSRTDEASRLLEIELVQFDEPPPQLTRLLERLRRKLSSPLERQARVFKRGVGNLGSLDPARIAALAQRGEALCEQLDELAGEDERLTGVLEMLEEQMDILDTLDQVADLQAGGRLIDAAAQLDLLGESRPALSGLVGRLKGDLGAKESTEQLLAEARALFRDSPEAAVEFARKHVARDNRFVAFIDFAVLDEARRSAKKLEDAGRYSAAIDHLAGARGGLSNPDDPRLGDNIRRLQRVHRDASMVTETLSALERGDGEREALLVRLSRLEVGHDQRLTVQRLMTTLLPARVAELQAGLSTWRRGEAVDVSSLDRSADFVHRHGIPGDHEPLLEEFTVCKVLADAAEALAQGEVDEAERLAATQMSSRFGERVATFMRACQARRALELALKAIGDRDFDSARQTLADVPAGNQQGQWARLFLQRLEPLVATIEQGDVQADVDPVDAYRRARALIEQQPKHHALIRLLEHLQQLRLKVTRARLAKADVPVLGARLRRMHALTLDFYAEGQTHPDLRAATDGAMEVADAELEEMLAWFATEAMNTDVDLKQMESVAHALPLAIRYYPERAELSVAQNQIGPRLAQIKAWQADRSKVEALLEKAASDTGRLQDLIDAEHIEARYPRVSRRAHERRKAWSESDTLSEQLAVELSTRDYDTARQTLRRIAALSGGNQLPHAYTVAARPDGQLLVRGVDNLLGAIDRLVRERAAATRKLIAWFETVERELQSEERSLNTVLQMAQNITELAGTKRPAQQIATFAERTQQALAEKRPLAMTIGMAERADEIARRLKPLGAAKLAAAIQQEVKAEADAVRWLTTQRGVPLGDLRAARGKIESFRSRFKGSQRVGRFAHLLLRRLE